MKGTKEMGESKKYQGGCHCGAVAYEVEADLSQSITCNCSICGRSGTILSFVPAASFALQKGEESLTDYTFNKHQIHHLFCKVCGVRSFARGSMPDGTPMVAVNARCLEGIDPFTLTPTQVDGKKF